MELKNSAPQVTDSALRLPGDVPEIPPEVIERFPEMAGWMSEFRRFWSANTNAVNEFARAVLDVTEIGGLFIVDGANTSIYIKGTRDRGAYADTDTPFYADKRGFFSLGSHLTWNPETLILTIDGTIYAEAGNIGGFELGPDYIRDEADTFGLASDSTGAPPFVRFWAGSAFAARGTAPFRVYNDGSIFASMGTIGGFVLGTDYIRDAGNSFGLASTVTGVDDVRFFAGSTFAARATAPFRVTEAGVVTAISGTIGGWTLAATTLSGTNAVLSSVGTLLLGTANDVAILDANDATYRLWIGNATAGSAAFSVTKAGLLTATSAIVGGTGTNGDYVSISSAGLQVGGNTAQGVFYVNNSSGSARLNMRYNGNIVLTANAVDVGGGVSHGIIQLSRSDGSGSSILDGRSLTLISSTTSTLISAFGSGGGITLDGAGAFSIFGTLSVTGSSAFAGISATTGSFSSTLNVSGASTLAAMSATTGSFSSTLSVSGNLSGSTAGFSGQVSADSFNATSSRRFKTNVRRLTGGLEIVRQLRAVMFDWRTKKLQNDIGFIAEEIDDVLPTMIGRDENGSATGVDYGRVSAVLVRAIQELEERIDGLRL